MNTRLLSIFLLFIAIKTHAQQFNPDSSQIYFLNNIASSSSSVNSFPDGNNGYYVLWLDSRTGANNTAVYFQHLNKFGVPQFAQNGKLLLKTSSVKIAAYTSKIVQNGIMVAWNQITTGYSDSLFCNYFDFNGNALWPQRTLVAKVSSGMISVSNNGLNILPTDSGVFINYSHIYVGGSEGFGFNRVLMDGSLRWPINYYQVSSTGYYWVTSSDNHNGFYYAVSTGGLGAHIYVQHFNQQGIQSYASNLDISSFAGGRGNSSWRLVCDEDTNAYVVWESYLSGSMVISKITPSHGLGWNPNYRTISAHSGTHTSPTIIFADNSIYSIWDDGRAPASNYFIYAQRTDTAGNMLWRADGDSICRLSSYIPTPFLTKNASGEIVTTFLMGNNFLAQKLDTNANHIWKANGRAISTSSAEKPFYGDYRLVSSPDSSTGIFWNSFNGRICAAKLNKYGNLENANPLPNRASVIVGSDTICAGDTAVSYSISAIPNATKYVWTLSNGVTSAASSDTTLIPSIALNFSTSISTATISVNGLNNYGMGASSGDFLIFLNSKPDTAGIITGLDSAAACTNQNNFTYSINPIARASYYYWTLPNLAAFVGNSDSTSVTVNYSPYSTSGTITVSAGNACGLGFAAQLPIYYKPIPTAEICYATVDSASQKTVLYWQKPVESYVNGYVVHRETAGVYAAIYTVPNTLYSSYLDTNSHPQLQAESYKIAVLDSCGNTGDISAPYQHQTIHLYGSIQPGGITKLYWNDYVGINDPLRNYTLLRDTLGTGPFNDTLASSILPAAYMNKSDNSSANYTLCRYVVEMNFESNCSSSQKLMLSKSTSRSNIKNKIALYDSSSVGINKDFTEFNKITIFPNPAKEILTISNLIQSCSYEIKVYNSIGKCVFQTENYGSDKKEINLQNLSKGLYLLKLKTKSEHKTFKIQLE